MRSILHVNTLKAQAASINFKCFKGILQVFHTVVIVELDRGVAFVSMVCTCMLQASVSNVSYVFQTYVASVFIWMLHMFHTYVASVAHAFAMTFKCF